MDGGEERIIEDNGTNQDEDEQASIKKIAENDRGKRDRQCDAWIQIHHDDSIDYRGDRTFAFEILTVVKDESRPSLVQKVNR